MKTKAIRNQNLKQIVPSDDRIFGFHDKNSHLGLKHTIQNRFYFFNKKKDAVKLFHFSNLLLNFSCFHDMNNNAQSSL
jgi:hypothetical protein